MHTEQIFTPKCSLNLLKANVFIGSSSVAAPSKPQAFLTRSGAWTDYTSVVGSIRQALTRPRNRPWAPARETATHKFQLHHNTLAPQHFFASSLSHVKRAKIPEPLPGQ